MGFVVQKKKKGEATFPSRVEEDASVSKKGAATHHFPLSYGIKSRSWNIPDLTLIQFPPPTLLG